jgi:hypothetical protein
MTVIQEKASKEVLTREPRSYPLASGLSNVAEPDPTRYLRIALRLVGVTFIAGIYTFVMVWPSGWSWHTGQSHHLPHYLQMILGVYATLGVFLLIASRKPLAHLSLIWFAVWSSVVHAAIMAAQALANSDQRGHLWGDVPALLVVAAILAVLTLRAKAATGLAAVRK